MKSSIQLYRNAISGHCHRVELLLSLLGLPFELIDVDLLNGEHKSPAFLALNPLGQVPVLCDGELTLSDSNAMLVYLEGRYAPGRWLPRDPVGAARVQRWLSLAAGPLAYGAASARVVQLLRLATEPKEAIDRATGLFELMEMELSRAPCLVGDQATLADLAHYAYVARAPEGLISLQPYPAIRAWLARIEALPGFVPMVKTPVGLAE
ncbi:glutathione S-transferase [Hydrogenophaga crassostreae]|uniref:Glutathione S-transferase n=1 Tax=Hydrogenophaga crassostreae TaxID=1763535 RepID=A0A162SVT4_9BURK|nr:glutathione S-transferase N-terminal domain-containing protein [Hydrogenophaga crassostreae]AOW12065.1 glutathione S-transferase [Hydrogenophaga crassostreae]OAD41009.1 glutathione S-transferase [Hydrogenophaga crassostreae]